jgi:hypothetical protein
MCARHAWYRCCVGQRWVRISPAPHTSNARCRPRHTSARAPDAQAGDEIIDALCKGSTTFEAKTEFAQEKYKRRKARKYVTRLTLRRPTGWSVCQVGAGVVWCGCLREGGGWVGEQVCACARARKLRKQARDLLLLLLLLLPARCCWRR